jgi:hypothetical protein
MNLQKKKKPVSLDRHRRVQIPTCPSSECVLSVNARDALLN